MYKKFLSVFLTILLIFSFIGSSQTYANNITIIINGQNVTFDQQPIIKDGTTLVPMRAFFEALGAKVDWNQSTQTVTGTRDNTTVQLTIGSKIGKVNGQNHALAVEAQIINGYTYIPLRFVGEALGDEVNYSNGVITINSNKAPQDTIKPSLGSRKNPAGIDDVINMHTETFDKRTFDSTIILKNIIRGNDAWKMVSNANMFNSKPEDGYEIILAKFYIKINKSSNEDAQFDLDPYNFILVSSDGKDYDSYICVPPSPNLRAKLYQGASNEGWVAFKVKINDLKPLIVYGKGYDGSGGVWFKGYTDTSDSNTTMSINSNTNQTIVSAFSQQQNSDAKINTINNANDLKTYLEQNYSSLDTSIGKTSFKFEIFENDSVLIPYDYWIATEFDPTFYYDIKYSIKYTDDQKEKVKEELKDFQEKLAKDIISKLPNKKIQGGYYYSYYRYPNLQIDLVSFYYYSWTNYDEPDILTTDMKKIYESTKPSTFRWYTLLDEQL
ncbi:stalk domain-containing protein [Thermoanaerobacterium thermosaccharolyticum]|uniref:copper amine oxidase N-terminal domain-containing protein n=1 Tax=Thermoanaerobacterium thermosaccharolyticum TaxID=1517 RepID=UPI003DA99079